MDNFTPIESVIRIDRDSPRACRSCRSAGGSVALSDALFTITRQRSLGLLIGRSDRGFFESELHLLDAAVQTVLAQAELLPVHWAA